MNGRPDSSMLEKRVAHRLELGHYAEAESLARSWVAAEPDSEDAHGSLALALRGGGHYQAAAHHAWEACRLAPDVPDSLIVFADCASAVGDHARAVQAARRAVEVAPLAWAAHYALARTLLATPRPPLTEVGGAVDEAVRLAPASADVHNLRGMYLRAKGDRRGARAAYERALALDPHSSVTLNNLASLDARLRPGRSADRLTSAVGLDPQHQVIRENVGVIAWNLLVSFYRALVLSGFIVVVLRAVDAPLWARIVALVCLTAGWAWLVVRGVRRLPRGLRRSLPSVWAGLSATRHLAAAGLAVEVLLLGMVALGPVSLSGIAWLAMIGCCAVLMPLRHSR